MNRTPLILATLSLAALAHAGDKIPWHTDWNAASAAAKKANKPIMIDFYTDWCGWCKKLDKDTYTDARVIELLKDFVPLKLNAEKNGRQLAQRYRVQGYPTILFVTADGQVLDRIGGYLPPKPFAQNLERIRQSWKLKQRRPELERRVKANPNDAEAHASLALIYSASSTQIKDAIRSFNAALKAGAQGDTLARAANNIGDHFWAKNKSDEALKWFQHASRLAKDTKLRAYALYSMMACHYREKRLDEARKIARDLLALKDARDDYHKAARWILKQKNKQTTPKNNETP